MINTNEFIQYIFKYLLIFDSPIIDSYRLLDKLDCNCKKWIFSNFDNYYVKNFISNCSEEDLDYINNYFNEYLFKNKERYNIYHYKIIKSLIKYMFIYMASNCSDRILNWFLNNSYLPEEKEKEYIYNIIPSAISLDFLTY